MGRRATRKAEKQIIAAREAEANLAAAEAKVAADERAKAAKKAQREQRSEEAKAAWAAKSPEEKKKIYKWVGIVVAILVVIGAISAAVGGSEESTDTAKDSTPAVTEQQAEAEPKPEAEPEKPKAPKGVEFTTSPGSDGEIVFATFKISDNLTKGMIRSVAQDDTVKILKYSKEAYPDAAKVFVQGKFPMKDAYGNTSEDMILNAGYDRATIDKINFDNVDPSKIWDLRDGGMVHRELQG